MATFKTNLVKTVQERLAALGYYRLRIDGIAGSGTLNAMSRFKAQNGYIQRPFPGPLTLTRLFSDDAIPAPAPARVQGEPLWLAEARNLLGVMETQGPGNTAEIMKWARDLDQWYPGDDTAWCGLFVAHCMAVGAPNEPQDFNRLGAREWLKYGTGADGIDIPLGGVCVFWRTHPTNSWHGHVFIATGQSQDAIRGIGGNQSDRVSETWIPRRRLLGVRVPSFSTPDDPRAPYAETGILSINES